MKKRLVVGTIKENNKKYNAIIEIETKTKKDKGVCLSICGEISRTSNDFLAGGQCIDTIADYFPNDEKVQKIKKIWERYHLNDMHPECEHQREDKVFMESRNKKIICYKWLHLNDDIKKEKDELKKYIENSLKNDGKVSLDDRQKYLYNAKDCLYNHYGDYDTDLYYHKEKDIEYKEANRIKESEHENGVLLKECPICGYKYGASWNYMPIPQNIIDFLESL